MAVWCSAPANFLHATLTGNYQLSRPSLHDANIQIKCWAFAALVMLCFLSIAHVLLAMRHTTKFVRRKATAKE